MVYYRTYENNIKKYDEEKAYEQARFLYDCGVPVIAINLHFLGIEFNDFDIKADTYEEYKKRKGLTYQEYNNKKEKETNEK